MKELVIISGKGGTGKTSLTAAFAAMASNFVICDSDVDAADLHLLLDPHPYSTNNFMGGSIAEIDAHRCNSCGLCRDLCRFEAISDSYFIDSLSCEGCGVCFDLCPEKAITFSTQKCGEWYLSETRRAPMVHARLGIAEENSGKLVSLIRQQAKHLAEQQGLELIITDGPPGVGCPVIATITGATLLLIVVEPSLSSVHDMNRVIELAEHFAVPYLLCINKYDINPELAEQIKKEAQARQTSIAGMIPFDPTFTSAMIEGKTIVDYARHSPLVANLKQIWTTISDSLQNCAGVERGIPIFTSTK